MGRMARSEKKAAGGDLPQGTGPSCVPGLLATLRRDAGDVLCGGQPWRQLNAARMVGFGVRGDNGDPSLRQVGQPFEVLLDCPPPRRGAAPDGQQPVPPAFPPGAGRETMGIGGRPGGCGQETRRRAAPREARRRSARPPPPAWRT